MTIDAPHIHHWILQAGLIRDVPGECACGLTRTFKGQEENMAEAYRNAPRRTFANYDRRSDGWDRFNATSDDQESE